MPTEISYAALGLCGPLLALALGPHKPHGPPNSLTQHNVVWLPQFPQL